MNLNTNNRPEVAVRCAATVGEGPVWDKRSGLLLWVDMAQGTLHRLALGSGAHASVRVAPMLCAVAPRREGGLVAVLGEGFALLHAGDVPELVHAVGGVDERMNDAKCDPAGRLWAGTTSATGRPGRGRLVRWDAEGVAEVWSGLDLTNGLGWSPDGSTFYLADSDARVLYSAPFDLESGVVGERRALVRFSEADGLPDGLCVDADGCIWLALWGGGEVRRYAPDGELVSTLEMPVSQPSSCAFGPGGTLFVTSAQAGLSEERLREEPLAGSLFAYDAGVAPAPVGAFAG
jgi:sugar lactone lactonase YvrE